MIITIQGLLITNKKEEMTDTKKQFTKAKHRRKCGSKPWKRELKLPWSDTGMVEDGNGHPMLLVKVTEYFRTYTPNH